MEHFSPPNSSEHLRSDAHWSQTIERDADVDHTQTIGGDTAKLLGGYIPLPPRVSAPVLMHIRPNFGALTLINFIVGLLSYFLR